MQVQAYTHFSWALGPISTEFTYGEIDTKAVGTSEEKEKTGATQEKRKQKKQA